MQLFHSHNTFQWRSLLVQGQILGIAVLRGIFLETKSIRARSDTRKQGKNSSPSASFDCEFGLGGVGKGRLEAYRMTDEEAAGGAGRTEASSILVAMHHGM
jgi:hypothetical protein